jgi:Zn-dependent protease
MIGSIVIPLINIFIFQSTYAIFGWGKPVMTRAGNFKHPRRDEILTCLAGPASNLALALVAAAVGSFVVVREPLLGELVFRLIVMNVGLALFNLLPIPPLDGGYLVKHFTGMSEEAFLTMARWGGIIMLVAFFLPVVRGAFGLVFNLACVPYYLLCTSINPVAAHLIFR